MTDAAPVPDPTLAPEVRCDLLGLRFRLPPGWQVTQRVTWESAPLPGCRVIVTAQRPGSDARVEIHGFRRAGAATLPIERIYAARSTFVGDAKAQPRLLGGRDAEIFPSKGQAPDGTPVRAIGFFVPGTRVCYGIRGEWARLGEDDEVAFAIASLQFGDPTENPPPTHLKSLRLETADGAGTTWGVRDMRLAHRSLLGKHLSEGDVVRLKVGERPEPVEFRVTGMAPDEKGVVDPRTLVTLDDDIV